MTRREQIQARIEAIASRIHVEPSEVFALGDMVDDLVVEISKKSIGDTEELERLRKLFSDAGQGEHNVLALIDHYQAASMESDSRIFAVLGMLGENGCDCCCCENYEEHDDDCDRCLACRIESVLRPREERLR